MSELFENNNNAGKDVPSMTQVQMEEDEEEEFYPSKRHTNNANNHDNMVEMTQIQMDDESSSGEDVCDNDDEIVFDNENDTMLIDEDDISGVINDRCLLGELLDSKTFGFVTQKHIHLLNTKKKTCLDSEQALHHSLKKI